jgi:hypothetical protein
MRFYINRNTLEYRKGVMHKLTVSIRWWMYAVFMI